MSQASGLVKDTQPHAVMPRTAAALVSWVCCGWCYPGAVECVDAGIQAVLRAVRCQHATGPERCEACSATLTAAMERAKNSGVWTPRSEDVIVGDTFDMLQDLSFLIRPSTVQLANLYEEQRDAVCADEFFEDVLDPLLPAVGIDQVTAAIDWQQQLVRHMGPEWGPHGGVENAPPRGYKPGEARIAQRIGLPKPQRLMVEERV